MAQELLPSPFKDFQLHDTWFDWKDPSLTPKSISRKLMGSVSYWDSEEFGEVKGDDGSIIREAMPPHEIEREILFESGREQWAYESAYGKPYYQHFLTLMALLDENTDITPTIADATYVFCMSFAHSIKVINLIGSQNAGKSAGSVRIAFCCFYIDPDFTAIYVANPFNNTAESTVWGDMLEMWDNLCLTHPHPDKERATYLFPKGYVYQDRYITAIPKLSKAGFIKLQDPKDEAKFKGGKTKKSNEPHRGLILHIFDEINEVKSYAYLNVLPNLSSQNFVCISSQNFKGEDDMGGLICEPVVRWKGDIGLYKDLEVDRDHFWSSAYASMTLRFDGARAANIQANRTIYSYLFKQADWDRLAEQGLECETFYSQARSFPVRGQDTNSVLSKAKISGSQYSDRWFTLVGNHTRVSFCDPAFGGKDKALWGFASFGPAAVVEGGGDSKVQPIFHISHHFVTLRLTKDATYNDHWLERMQAVGIDSSVVVVGAEVSVEDQIAIQCAELNVRHGISPDNFGFDFSMRADIVSSIRKFLGFECKAFEYNLPPEGYKLESLNTTTTDYCKDRITELCYLTADLFNSRQFRGGEYCETAITQLSRTKAATVLKKRKCQNKREYKAQNKQVSPDDRDVLIGLVGMAAARGMTTKVLMRDMRNVTPSEDLVTKKFKIRRARRI